jgi:predicted nucleic acid-binding protein
MNALDTNVLIYRLDNTDPVKQAKARVLVRRLRALATPTVLPWQALGELVRQLRSWQDQGRLTRPTLLKYVAAVRKAFPVVMPIPDVLDEALALAGRYSLSHWDSMILGACKAANVTTLYTEDMGAPTQYDGVQLLNPFI